MDRGPGGRNQEPVSSYSSIGDDYRSLACSRLPENAYRADAKLRYSDFALTPDSCPSGPWLLPPGMRCPYCHFDHDRVMDSRASEDGYVIRRRRECLHCKRRYTTY